MSIFRYTGGNRVRPSFRSHRNLPPLVCTNISFHGNPQTYVAVHPPHKFHPLCQTHPTSHTPPADTPGPEKKTHPRPTDDSFVRKTDPGSVARPRHADTPAPSPTQAQEQSHLGGCRYTLVHTVHDTTWHAHQPRTQSTSIQTPREDGRDVRMRLPPKPSEKKVQVRSQCLDGLVQSWNEYEEKHELTRNTSAGRTTKRLPIQQLQC